MSIVCKLNFFQSFLCLVVSDDPSNEVQTIAVKCLSILLRRVNQNQIIDISKKLAILILDGNASLRDIYSICMKTLIADVPDSMGKAVSDHLSNALITGIDRPLEDVKKECLDNVTELLKRFGHELSDSYFNRIMTSTIQQLKHPKPNIRKRASNTLGALAFVLSEESLSQLINVLLARIGELERGSTASKSSPESATLIATIGVISRTVGYKLGRYLGDIVPLFIRFCGEPDDEDLQTDQGNELRESCFPGLESFVMRCPKEIIPHLSDILAVSLKFVEYDPNYQYDDDNGDSMDVEGEDFGDDEYYGESMGSDDDDSSWKVRKAAVKVITATISAHPSMVRELYETSADSLLNRFKEREENVRLDIINCFTKLVELNLPVADFHGTESGWNAPRLMRQKSTSNLLSDKVSLIMRVSSVHLNGNSINTKIAIARLLKALVQALQGGIDEHLSASSKLSGQLEKLLQEKNQTLKLETLNFFRVCYAFHPSSVVLDSATRFLPMITRAVGDEWYKIIAESLRVLETMIINARPLDAVTGMLAPMHPALESMLPKIFDCVMSRLVALDIDIEIKECGISCVGTLFKHCGDRLENQLPEVLALLQKRLENETTRTATLRALSAIAQSPLSLNLSAFTASSGDVLASFLKQYSRNLKQLTLQTITALVNNPHTQLTAPFATAIITESAGLVHENDLHLANLTLSLLLTTLRKDANSAVAPLCEVALPRLLRFAKSAVTQGAVIESLVQVFRCLVSLSDRHASLQFGELFSNLYDTTRHLPTEEKTLSRSSLANVSKCIAAITTTLPTVSLAEGVQRFARDAFSTDDSVAQLALFSMGEVGQQADLSMLPDLKDVILQCFQRSHEDVKLAAAYAFGHIAVGSMHTFLPLLLASISSPADARQQYLLLTALRETIVAFATLQKDFSPYLDTVLPILLNKKDAEEESVRNMVAECLGVLTTMAPDRLVSLLCTQLLGDASNKCVLRVAANAMRVATSRSVPMEVTMTLRECMRDFLHLLRDDDLDVKKAALLMINSAAHHNIAVLSSFIPTDVFPVLLETLQIKLERVIDLGPFKHKVDDNLVLRKLSLSSLEILLAAAPDKFDANAVMELSEKLVVDHEEVKMLFIQILPRIAKHTPGAVAIKIEIIFPLLEKMMAQASIAASASTATAAGGAPTQSDAKGLIDHRTLLKVILQLDKFDDIRNISRRWCEFVGKIRGLPTFVDTIRQLEAESADSL